MILQRCGNDGDPLAFFIPTEVNPNPIDQARELYNIQTFGQFVIYGFFFYILLQIISIILDDKSPVMVCKMIISISLTRFTNHTMRKNLPKTLDQLIFCKYTLVFGKLSEYSLSFT